MGVMVVVVVAVVAVVVVIWSCLKNVFFFDFFVYFGNVAFSVGFSTFLTVT